jgi:predicted DNA-binding protein (MmcQ/YjbR family)
MDIIAFRNFCLKLKGTSEGFPFDNKTLVFKVGGKMFALTDVDSFVSINLKANPEKSIVLRETFNAVNPGFHMNKKHWNTIDVNSDLNDELLLELILDSYNLVVKSLTKKTRDELSIG